MFARVWLRNTIPPAIGVSACVGGNVMKDLIDQVLKSIPEFLDDPGNVVAAPELSIVEQVAPQQQILVK